MIENHGISHADAVKTVNNCLKSMSEGALKTYFAAGAVLYFMNTLDFWTNVND